MDKITQQILDEFVAGHGLGKLDEQHCFEQLAGYLVISDHYSETFDTDDVWTGGDGEVGIDCVGIIVNNCLVTEPEEVDDLAKTNNYLDVTFVFVQAERSSSFDMQKLGHFGYAVTDLFAEAPKQPQSKKIVEKGKIVSEIIAKSRLFTRGNPQCFLYYVTTGRWQDDPNLVARRDAVKEDLESLNMFRRVEYECLGADRIQQLNREANNAVLREILFAHKVLVPDLPSVQEAYIGLLPASEFLKLIESTNEEILTSIFFDNIRHWQDWNDVNTAIRDTLADPTSRVYFPLLNNGVTIVTRRLTPTGNRFVLEDYQIVNGCQTSFVLHFQRDVIDDSVFIPVRLIATDDASVRNSIIKGTNRQTPVTDEQLFALEEFPKKLEEFFSTFKDSQRLYYERRSRQYNGQIGVEKVRIITMTVLVRAFASVFLKQPHRTTRNYKALLSSIGKSLFRDDHILDMYYVAAYTHYRLDSLFRRQVLSPDLKPARYHLLLAFRAIVTPGALPPFNSHDMKKTCDTLCHALWDDDKSQKVFLQAADYIKDVAQGNLHRDHIRTEPFTDKLVAVLESEGYTV